MAITTINKPLKKVRVQFSCNNLKCLAVLEAGTEDGMYQADQRDGAYYVFLCPHCDSKLTVAAAKFFVPA